MAIALFLPKMVVVAQLVRAPDCGSGGRRFETDLPPNKIRDCSNAIPFFGTIFGTIIKFSKRYYKNILQVFLISHLLYLHSICH